MKIKILKTGQVVDAYTSGLSAHCYVDFQHSRLNPHEYEIIPEPPQLKFRIGDKVSYVTDMDAIPKHGGDSKSKSFK